MRHTALLALICALLVVGPVSAQEQRGSIEGVVRDSSGAVLPGVNVEARSQALIGVAVATTNEQGIYRFPALPPGRYEVTASLQGFGPVKVEDINLALGQLLKIDLTLAPAAVAESIQVTAESPIIDVKQNASFATLQREFIDKIPKGRDFTSLVTLAPGANRESKAGGFSIDGASGSENKFIVDGLDTTGLRTGVSGREVLTDVLDEVQVKSSGYNAEFGGALGGVVSATIRTGSNVWHGDAGLYNVNTDELRGKMRPSVRLNPADQRFSESIRFPSDDFSIWEPGFTFGGPVRRNRIWFFTSYLPQVESNTRTVTFRSNGATGTFGQTIREHKMFSSLSAQITSQIRAKVSHSFERRHERGSLPSLDGTSNPALNFSELGENSNEDTYPFNVDYVATEKLYVNVRGGYYTYNSHELGRPTGIRRSFTGSNFQFPEIPPELRNVNGFADTLSNTAVIFDKYGRLTLNVDATHYRSWAGQHAFKGGVQLERLSNKVKSGVQAPNVTLNWDASRATLDGRRVRGTYGFYSVGGLRRTGDVAVNNVALFVQDSWTIMDRLTINAGLRTEKEDVPSYVPQNPGIHFGFGEKLAPRLGFAWDVGGDNKWKAYGSWGMFYDMTKLEMPRGSFGGEKSITYYYTLDTFNWPSIACAGPPGTGCPGTFIEQVDFRHPANALDNNLIEPNIKQVRTQEFTVGLDHELNRTTSVGVRYVHKWLDRTIEDVGILVPGVGEVFMIANPGFGIAEYTIGRQFPAQPRATRDYDGVELRLRKRLSDHWSVNTSYLWSRLWGNYSGLANSDENGRTSPNVNRIFDGIYYSFNQQGQPVFGQLQTDRPHQFKVQATYDLPWRTSVGVFEQIQSGTPLQRQVSEKGIPFFYLGRVSEGRTPTYSQTDLLLQHDIALPHATRLNLSVNAENLFDQETVTNRFMTELRDSLNISDEAFFAGFDVQQIVARTPSIRRDPRFGLPGDGNTVSATATGTTLGGFQSRRQIRFAVKYVF